MLCWSQMAKKWIAHAAVLLLLLVIAVGVVRIFDAPTDVIRAVPLVYFLYIAVVLILYGIKKTSARRKR